MTATTKAVNRPRSIGPLDRFVFTVATSATLYQGALCALNSSGLLVDATETTAIGPFFIVEGDEAPDNPATGSTFSNGILSSAAAGTKIYVRTGYVWLANGESIDNSHVGGVAYCDDNVTVKVTATGTSPVGVILAVDSVLGVLVSLYPHDSAVPDDSITSAKIAAGAVDSSEIASGAVDPVHLASGCRVVAADGALTLGATDRLIEITGTAGGTIAATMTATHAGHCVRVRMRAGDGTHHYTLAAKYNGSAGTVLMNAANELVDLYYDGSAWNVAFLSGATWS